VSESHQWSSSVITGIYDRSSCTTSLDRSTLQWVTTPCLNVTTKLDRNVEISTSRSRRGRILPSRGTRLPRQRSASAASPAKTAHSSTMDCYYIGVHGSAGDAEQRCEAGGVQRQQQLQMIRMQGRDKRDVDAWLRSYMCKQCQHGGVCYTDAFTPRGFSCRVSENWSDRPYVWCQNIRSALFGFVKHACDRQTETDGQTEFRQLKPR